MAAYELAQLNIGIIKGPMDSPVMAEFAANLDRINAVAESSSGFVWRLQTPEGNATAIRPFDNENVLVNMSVWQDADALRKFVYRSAHSDILRRRREWFEKMSEVFLVLWWVPRGHRPSLEEAIARLELLRLKGPHSEAFTFRETFPPPDASATEQPGGFPDECPAT
jgi:Domain of unknown function (DUF3291)